MLVATFWLAFIVAIPGWLPWGLTAVAIGVLTAAFLTFGSARIEVADGFLTAGKARIEVRFLGTAEALDAEQARHWAGRGADPRAFLLLRPYLKRAVRVPLTDPADPTPYWLLATRHPEQLTAALDAERSAETTPVTDQRHPS